MYVVQWIIDSDYLEEISSSGLAKWVPSRKNAKLFQSIDEVKSYMKKTSWCGEYEFDRYHKKDFICVAIHPLNIKDK